MTKQWTEEDEKRVLAEQRKEKQRWCEALKHAAPLRRFMSKEGFQEKFGYYDSDIDKLSFWMNAIFEEIKSRVQFQLEQEKEAELEESQGDSP